MKQKTFIFRIRVLDADQGDAAEPSTGGQQ